MLTLTNKQKLINLRRTIADTNAAIANLLYIGCKHYEAEHAQKLYDQLHSTKAQLSVLLEAYEIITT